ncbi:MAG TPA: AMP nucleosidase [Alphaproteobacteria bacterium]|nr:AMP nucleosidase [Alphaproteobacteria bacterium]
MSAFAPYPTAAAAIDALSERYQRSIMALRAALERFVSTGASPTPEMRASGAFAYPELRVIYTARGPAPRFERAFARFNTPGTYAVTITRPDLFRPYLLEQLEPLIRDYGAEVLVGASGREIPYPYVLDGANLPLGQSTPEDLARHFPTTYLSHIGDELADGLWDARWSDHMPLALFDAPRTDFSLARLRHYTGTPPEHIQSYILFTNYHRYVDEFVRFAADKLREKNSPFTALSCAGGVIVTRETPDIRAAIADSAWRRHQMPAYHLMAEGREGISLVNIGVGPSNAKTITDHLAVLRPEAWLMIGHCGGLRPSQIIGDYVLAHAYLRDDKVLDDVLPPQIPLPAIAEVQQALQEAAAAVTGETGDGLKRRLRTGTVVTTDDRNWELRYTSSALQFNRSRAVAIDMESGTIAAQGYRFRVPYGTLLCVSDKPLHGELKLPGQANRFYERAISEHIKIGIETAMKLKGYGERLHSRKLRAFDEPPFR